MLALRRAARQTPRMRAAMRPIHDAVDRLGASRMRRATGVCAIAACLLGACDEQALRLPRSDAELAEAARRGDSLTAQIAVGQAIADSLDRIARGELPAEAVMSLGGLRADDLLPDTTVDGAPRPSAAGRAITEGALARADSITLAAAQRADSLARAVTAARLRAPAGGNAGAARADTMRGIITVDGVPPAVRVYLVPDAPGAERIALTGLAVRDLLNLDGLEVSVRGVPNGPSELVVTAFVARAYNGAPVLDGLLLRTGDDSWAIRLTEGGTRSLGAVTSTLQRFAGSRVWIARSSTSSFGVITKR